MMRKVDYIFIAALAIVMIIHSGIEFTKIHIKLDSQRSTKTELYQLKDNTYARCFVQPDSLRGVK